MKMLSADFAIPYSVSFSALFFLNFLKDAEKGNKYSFALGFLKLLFHSHFPPELAYLQSKGASMHLDL